jgi:hypothetical protein
MDSVWAFLHLFFGFSFVGSLVVADWNGRAARAAQDWGLRAALLEIVARSSRVAGLGSLLLLGVFGNLWSGALGYRMATDSWLHWVNGVWLFAVLLMALVAVPQANRLLRAARAGARGEPANDYQQALGRWRLAQVGLSIAYLALLALMVFRWRT